MAFKPVRVLIVDDSAFFRRMISDTLASDPRFEVVGSAQNGREALDKVGELKPDVVTMDINMPVMDGLEALHSLMLKRPTPVIMLSSVAVEGAYVTVRALEEGAVDFLLKPQNWGSVTQEWRQELIQKLLVANRAKLISSHNPTTRTSQQAATQRLKPSTKGKIVAIGSSTGGPGALREVLTRLPGDFPCGVLIVQHMPPLFTRTLADRLNASSQLEVKEAQSGDLIKPGVAYIAPGDYHMVVNRSGAIILNQDPPVGSLRPAVDILFDSVAEHYSSQVIAAVLTGMGSDGRRGARRIKDEGGIVLAQSEKTCVVYGMPRAVVDAGLADAVVPLPKMAEEIRKLC